METPSLPLKWVKWIPDAVVISANSVADSVANSVFGADGSCVCVAAGSATSRRIAMDVMAQENASEHGKHGLPSEVSFNVDPRVAREVSLGNANGRVANM